MEFITVKCNNCEGRDTADVASGPDFEYACSDQQFTVVRCRACGLAFLNPRPAPSALPVIYPEDYIPYRFDDYLPPLVNRIRMAMQKSKVRAVERYAPKDAAIWDVGCGGGFLLDCLKKYGPASWTLTGFDISETALERVRAKGFATRTGRFETMDIEDQSADVIILNQVIEHLDDPAAVVRRAHAALKPGGFLFIETPSLDGWDARLFKARHWGGWHFPRHWTLYDKSTIRQLLESNGFEIKSLQWLLSPNFWAQSCHHWLVDHGAPEKIARIMDCRNLFVMAFFTVVDMAQTRLGHTSNMRVVCRKIS